MNRSIQLSAHAPSSLAVLQLPFSSPFAAETLPVGPVPAGLPRLINIWDDVYTIENANATLAELQAFGGNVTVYLTDEGVVLVDAKKGKNARRHRCQGQVADGQAHQVRDSQP